LCLALALSTTATAWDVETLGAALADNQGGRVAFTETRHTAYLTAPVELSGVLVREGERLEKHVLAPAPETFIISGGSAEITTATGERHSLALNDHPLLRGLAAALRAALTGQTDRLQRDFDLSLEGDETDWRLRLFPRADDLRITLQEIVLGGRNGQVGLIRIEERNGDISEMLLTHGGQ